MELGNVGEYGIGAIAMIMMGRVCIEVLKAYRRVKNNGDPGPLLSGPCEATAERLRAIEKILGTQSDYTGAVTLHVEKLALNQVENFERIAAAHKQTEKTLDRIEKKVS